MIGYVVVSSWYDQILCSRSVGSLECLKPIARWKRIRCHFNHTSCSISTTLGTLCRLTPANLATSSIWKLVSTKPQLDTRLCPSWNHWLTHCCIVSTSCWLTPILRVPRKCQAVSSFRFWIMIADRTTISVLTSSSIWRSERKRPYVMFLVSHSSNIP